MAGTSFPPCRGYSLHEVLIAMGLSSLILVGMGLVLNAQNHAYRAQGAEIDTGRTLDAAVKQLKRDLQLAGAGLPPGTLPAIIPGNGNGGPLITIRYLTEDPFVTTLTADASAESKLFRIPPMAVRHFRRDDQVLIHREGTWLVFWVAAVQSGTHPSLKPHPGFQHSPGEAWIPLVIPRGSEVVRLRDGEIHYRIEESETGDRRLLRLRGARESVVAARVQDFHIEYLVAPPDEDTGPLWTPTPPADTPVLGTRARLTVGRSSARFTVTPRNLSLGSPS